MTQNEGRSTLCTTGSVFLQLLAWVAFTTTARSLHFVFQMLFAVWFSKIIIPDCLQFIFHTPTANIFCFTSVQLNDLQRNGSCRSTPDFLSPCYYRRATEVHLLRHECNTDRKYAQKWGISEYLHKQACNLLLSFNVPVIMTFKKSREDRKILNSNNKKQTNKIKKTQTNKIPVDFYKQQESTIHLQWALQLIPTYK